MKFSTIATLALLSATADAFAPAPTFGLRSTSLKAADGDASALIKEAEQMSEKFGSTSKEAKLAWEAVEEVSSADNSEATKAGLNEECDVTDDMIDSACMDYNSKMEELDRLLKSTPSASMPSLESIEAIKLVDVPQQAAAEPSAQLQEALASAKQITEEKGIQSPEARVAWETVEEIASASEKADALGGSISPEECLVDAAKETCAAMEELNRLMESKK